MGVGVGVPGTVDNRRGIAVHYEFICGWRNIPLADQLAQTFGVPVYLENNIRAMAVAERWFGGALKLKTSFASEFAAESEPVSLLMEKCIAVPVIWRARSVVGRALHWTKTRPCSIRHA